MLSFCLLCGSRWPLQNRTVPGKTGRTEDRTEEKDEERRMRLKLMRGRERGHPCVVVSLWAEKRRMTVKLVRERERGRKRERASVCGCKSMG